MHHWILRTGLLLVVAWPSLAMAQGTSASSPTETTEARAKELYENGAVLYDEGRYEDAIVAWQEAHRLSGRPALLFNIANAQERLGRWKDAYDTLNLYRAYAPAEEREALNRRIINLEGRIKEMEAQAAQPAAPTQPPPDTSVTPSTPPPTATPDKDPFPVAAVALYGLGAASLVTGTVFGLQARGARSDAASQCVDTGATDDAGAPVVYCDAAAADPLARDRTASLVADICFAVGGLSLVGGTTALLLEGDGWWVRTRVVPGGLALDGRF